MRYFNIRLAVEYFIKLGELRNQSPIMETILAKNVNQIIYGCCTLIIVVNKTGSSSLHVLKTISSSNVVRVPNFCCVFKFWQYKSMISSTFHFFRTWRLSAT